MGLRNKSILFLCCLCVGPGFGLDLKVDLRTFQVKEQNAFDQIESFEPSSVSNRKASESLDPFPSLPCLASQVAFWERVYRDLDSHMSIVHHRHYLDQVFAVVSSKEHKAAYIQSLAKRMNLRLQDIRVQQGLKNRFAAGVRRSVQFFPIIYMHLKAQKMPLDLVYLPHVESSYDPGARSRVGAEGLWQIMPQTMADLLGKWAVPYRRDIDISSEAAVKLLKQNYNSTQSWPLALTAYNHGLTGVFRAIKQTESKDLCHIIRNYSGPSFRFASSNFYAQFLAARNVAREQYAALARTQHQDTFRAKQLWAQLERDPI